MNSRERRKRRVLTDVDRQALLEHGMKFYKKWGKLQHLQITYPPMNTITDLAFESRMRLEHEWRVMVWKEMQRLAELKKQLWNSRPRRKKKEAPTL